MSIDFSLSDKEFKNVINNWDISWPVEFENEKDSEELRTAKKTKQDWLRMTIVESTYSRDSHRDRNLGVHFSSLGILIFDFFIRFNITSKEEMESKASEIFNIFSEERFQCIDIYSPEYTTLGRERDWFRGRLKIQFRLDQR